MWSYLLTFAFLHVTLCQHQHPHNHGEIMKDINNLYMHYTDDLCHDILLLDCGNSNNTVCGSDNVEYHDHCHFAKARCQDSSLTLLVRGSCQILTTPRPSTVNILGGGASTVGGGATGQMSTAPATTSLPGTTLDPAFAIIHDVFCANTNQISCNTSPKVDICGTDGHIYDSQCLFSKVKCIKTDLEVAASPSFCGSTTP